MVESRRCNLTNASLLQVYMSFSTIHAIAHEVNVMEVTQEALIFFLSCRQENENTKHDKFYCQI